MSGQQPDATPTVPEVAYYYPEWHWSPDEHSWVKSMLLFFDEVALLVPNYKRHEPANLDPELAGALEDRGLLRIIEPEEFVDAEMTRGLSELIATLIDAGAFDDLPRPRRFAELSMSRAGYFGERDTAEAVIDALRSRGLATETEDGVSIPMHPTVRSTYLVLLAQLARRTGERRGLDLHPATNRPEAHDVISRTLDLPPMPSHGRVVDFDLQVVSLDLDLVPLDEVLSFRDDHRQQHRRYMADLRSFCREVSRVDNDVDRARLLDERREELREAAASLRGSAFRAFKHPKTAVSFGLGLIGAGVAAASHSQAAAAVAVASQLLHLLPDPEEGSVYSYLFAAQRDL